MSDNCTFPAKMFSLFTLTAQSLLSVGRQEFSMILLSFISSYTGLHPCQKLPWQKLLTVKYIIYYYKFLQWVLSTGILWVRTYTYLNLVVTFTLPSFMKMYAVMSQNFQQFPISIAHSSINPNLEWKSRPSLPFHFRTIMALQSIYLWAQ